MGKPRKRRQTLRDVGRRAAGSGENPGGSSGEGLQSIFDIFAEVTRQVPKREWERLPTDLAKNLDHYLYGAEKKEK
jgi:hypothetical protein